MGLVLVIDDHGDTRYAVLRLLNRWGHQTIDCDTGEAAIALLIDHCPDLIIVDGMMPGMGGVEFIRLVRSNPDRAFIPAVLYTAIADRDYAVDAMSKGANEVWSKAKMDFQEMRERVEYFVNGLGKLC